MALTIDQITAASYPAIVAAARKPANQWSEHSLLDEMEKQKAIVYEPFGATLEEPLDYRRNQGGDFLETDMTSTSLTKTEVLTSASYAVASIAVPITWSEEDEVKNPSENQKVALVKSLVTNALDTHDDMIEEGLFTTVTDRFLGFQTVLPDSGQGSPGGIDASTELFWRNYTSTYLAAGTNLVAALTTARGTAAKGSGSKMKVSLIFSGINPYAIYMGVMQPLQRFIDSKAAEGGFEQAAFETARWVHSQYGGTRIYGITPKSFKLKISKDAKRKLLEKAQVPNAVAWNRKVYSALQLVTNNKSRGFVLTQV